MSVFSVLSGTQNNGYYSHVYRIATLSISRDDRKGGGDRVDWINQKNPRKISGFTMGVIFIGFYIAFSLGMGMMTTFLFPMFHLLALFRDSTLILTVILYFFLIMLLFAYMGVKYAQRVSSRLIIQILIVLPVTFTGLLIWYMTFDHLRDSNTHFGDFSWFLYTVYVWWSMPALESLREYYPYRETLMYIGILPSALPGLSFLVGIWLAKFFTWSRAAVLPILLAFFIALSAIVPVSANYTIDTYPRVDGATAAIPFGQVLARELTGVSVLKSKEMVVFNKSHEAYVNLINKKADIIFVSGPSDDERKLAEEKNVGLKLTPIAKDAFIFIVHKSNPVERLSIKQVQDIYSGKITNWKDVGGDDAEIKAYQRNENSGSQTFMEKKVMMSIPMAKAPMSRVIGGMGGLIEEVAEYKNAKNSMGYSFYYFANEMHQNENVKFIAVDGVPVNKENIINENYPFTATLYAVTREEEPAGSAAHQLLRWIQSSEGSKVIEKGGFVPF